MKVAYEASEEEMKERNNVKLSSKDPEDYKNASGYSAAENHGLEVLNLGDVYAFSQITNTPVQDIYQAWDSLVDPRDFPLLEDYVHELVARKPRDRKYLLELIYF